MTLAAHAKLAGAPDVRLYNLNSHATSRIIANDNQVDLRGNSDIKGKAKLDLVTTDAAEVAKGANLFPCDTPASSHADVVRQFAPFLEDGDVFMFHPERTGVVLEAREVLNKLNIQKSVILIEAKTLLYACRLSGTSANAYGVKDFVSIEGEDPEAVKPAIEKLAHFVGHGCWKIEESVLSTSFSNIGMLFHPAITLLNLARMQRASRIFLLTCSHPEYG